MFEVEISDTRHDGGRGTQSNNLGDRTPHAGGSGFSQQEKVINVTFGGIISREAQQLLVAGKRHVER